MSPGPTVLQQSERGGPEVWKPRCGVVGRQDMSAAGPQDTHQFCARMRSTHRCNTHTTHHANLTAHTARRAERNRE
eukprot:326469-Chlamydomonas_euryale.AAC.1